MHFSDDRVLETSTTTGTGPFTLAGAVAGHKAHAAALRPDGTAVQAGDTFHGIVYGVDANGNASGEWAEGICTLTTLSSVTITTTLRSSNSNAVVTFSAGTKYIAPVASALNILLSDNLGAYLLKAVSGEPSTPPASSLLVYAQNITSSWTALKNKRPSGVDSPLQDAIMFNRAQVWKPSNNTSVAIGAGALTFAGTATAVTISSGSAKSNMPRTQRASAATPPR